MIVVNINAGLANQMFHYAFGRGLIAKGYDIFYDQTNFSPRKQWSFESIRLQDAFPNLEIKQMPEGHFKWVCTEYSDSNKLKKRIASKMRRLLSVIGYENYIIETTYAYQDAIESKISRNCIFRGFWQSEKYFKKCEEDVRKQFTFLPFDEPKNVETALKMKNENSVAIHLRKGKDYLASALMGNGLCGSDYYMRAIEYISERIINPVFYVFTDNPMWVKENLPKFDYTLVDWNEVSGKRSFRDMQLMSCAKHNIIANSTYSWWGAWLNPNPDKIIVAPKKFFNPINEFFSSSDILCDEWVKI